MSAPDASLNSTSPQITSHSGQAIVWQSPDTNDCVAGRTARVSLEDLDIPAAWYSIDVWTSDEESVVSVRARFLEGRRADLRIRMEPAGKKRFQKIFKIAEPISSLAVSLAGEHDGRRLCRIELRALGKLSIIWFLVTKAARYSISNRGRFNWKTSWSHLSAALHPRGNFAFRSRYDRAGAGTYERWRVVHESTNSAVSSVKTLKAFGLQKKLKLALIVSRDLNLPLVKNDIGSLMIDPLFDIDVITVDQFKVSAEKSDFLILLDRSGRFPAGAIERLILEFFKKPYLAAIFADNDFITPDGMRQDPRLKPPWDRELLWCTDYIRAPIVMRWAPDLAPALDFPGADHMPGYALSLALLAHRPRECLGHVPAILFHQTDAQEPDKSTGFKILVAHLAGTNKRSIPQMLKNGIFKIDWSIPAPPPKASIIIPSKDNPETLKICIDSIISDTEYSNYEIVIADNGSVEEPTKDYLNSLNDIKNIKILSLPGPFNFSKINNDARTQAVGEILIFLNDDTKVISRDWLSELVSLASRDNVGAVGALLLYPGGSVQHAGVLLGVGGPADHAFRYLDGNSPGYLGLLQCRREVTAVTGACLAVSAEHFDAVGGFDDQLMVTCNDVDLCLRLRAAGLVNVWTPWARLEHWESMSRGVDFTDVALERQASELRLMSERWGDLLDRDPTYHQGLNDFEPNYCLSS